MGRFTLSSSPCRIAREHPDLVAQRTAEVTVEVALSRLGARRLREVADVCRAAGLEVVADRRRAGLGVVATLRLTGPLMTCARARLALEEDGLVPADGEGRRLLAEAKRDVRARAAIVKHDELQARAAAAPVAPAAAVSPPRSASSR